jgi:hypothetical protein
MVTENSFPVTTSCRGLYFSTANIDPGEAVPDGLADWDVDVGVSVSRPVACVGSRNSGQRRGRRDGRDDELAH